MKRILYVFFFLLLNKTIAQDYSHTGLWTKVTLEANLTKNLTVEGEYNYRFQSDYHVSTLNPTSAFYVDEKKITLSYEKTNWTFYLSPFEEVHSKTFLSKETDFQKPITHEYRLSGGVAYEKEFGKNTFQLRNLYEFRFMEDANRARLRTKLQWEYALNKNSSIKVSDEVFFNIPPNKYPNDFNQNRLFLTFDHEFSKHLELETGYIYLLSERTTQTEFDNLHALIVYLTVKL